MNDAENWSVQLSLRFGENGQHMLNVRADSLMEIRSILMEFFGDADVVDGTLNAILPRTKVVDEETSLRLVKQTLGAQEVAASAPAPAPATPPAAPETHGRRPQPEPTDPAEKEARGYGQPCKVCGAPKTKWVPGGYSERLKRNYRGFYGCTEVH